MLSKKVLGLQLGLDTSYDAYAFGREDLKKGIVAAGSGLPGGVGGAMLGSRLPGRYGTAGQLVGSFAGAILGSEAGLRALDRIRTAPSYQHLELQPKLSNDLQQANIGRVTG